MVFGHLSPIGVVSPIVVVATQCGNSSSSLKSTVLASRTQRCTGSRLRHRTDGSDSGPSPERRLVLAASRVRPRSASQSTQTAQGLCTSATMRPTKRRHRIFRQSGNRSGTSTRPSPLQSPRVSLPLSRDSKPTNRIEWAMGLTHRGLHRDGIGPKRTDDTFGQACRIAFASLRQTDDFFSDRCRHGSPTVSDI